MGKKKKKTDQHDNKRSDPKTSTQLFRNIFTSIQDGISILDRDMNIVLVNPTMEKWYSHAMPLVGKKCYEAYLRINERCEDCPTYQAMKTGRANYKIIPRTGANGKGVGWLELYSFPLFDAADGKVKGAIEYVRDITERKRDEEALRESEEKYRAILENIEDGYFEVDLSGNFTFFNDSVCRMLGYSRDEVIGMNNRQYMDEENAKKLYQAFNNVYRTGEPTKGFDWGVIRKDGTKLYIEASVSLRKNSSGQPIGFRGISRDITERKKLEEAIEKSEERYRTLVEESFDGIFIQKGGGIIFANRRLHKMLGFEEGKLVGLDHWLVYHPDYQALTRERAKARMQGESVPSTYEVKFLRKDGSSFWGEIHAKVISFLGEPGIQVWARDISERKQAEEALHRSEEESKNLAKENVAIAEIGRIISSTLNIEEVYQRFAEEVHKLIPFNRISINITNFKNNTVTVAYALGLDVPDRRVGDIFPLTGSVNEYLMKTKSSIFILIRDEKDVQEVMATLPNLLPHFQSGIRSLISVPLLAKDIVIGVLHLRSLKVNAYSELDLRLAERVGNQIAGAIANVQLFKELIQTEEDKIAIQEQLRQSQKMEAIGGLAGGVAHDFNNLLTVIKGYAELSRLGLDTSDPLRGNIEEILKASERAANLTRQLLAFSRRQILDFKVINLNTLLKDLDKMLNRILGEDIDLVYHLAEDIGKVKTDPGQIEQVILNLAVNARDAMPSGGKLTIETLNMELLGAYAKTHMEVTPGHYVMLSVSDSGAGMTNEVRERIFEPFFTTKEKGKGTGLGLSTVYGIVKQSGGNINVYSEPGFGTTFKIYLPRVEEEEDNLQRKDLDISLSTGNETILLAEDEQSVRELAARILRDRGYQVYEAPDGKDALNMVQGHPEIKIDLLLTDVVMPGMSGKELADRLKLSMPDIKVLFISGYTDNAIVHHGVLMEGVEFLQKPFTNEALARKVREVLDR